MGRDRGAQIMAKIIRRQWPTPLRDRTDNGYRQNVCAEIYKTGTSKPTCRRHSSDRCTRCCGCAFVKPLCKTRNKALLPSNPRSLEFSASLDWGRKQLQRHFIPDGVHKQSIIVQLGLNQKPHRIRRKPCLDDKQLMKRSCVGPY